MGCLNGGLLRFVSCGGIGACWQQFLAFLFCALNNLVSVKRSNTKLLTFQD